MGNNYSTQHFYITEKVRRLLYVRPFRIILFRYYREVKNRVRIQMAIKLTPVIFLNILQQENTYCLPFRSVTTLLTSTEVKCRQIKQTVYICWNVNISVDINSLTINYRKLPLSSKHTYCKFALIFILDYEKVILKNYYEPCLLPRVTLKDLLRTWEVKIK